MTQHRRGIYGHMLRWGQTGCLAIAILCLAPTPSPGQGGTERLRQSYQLQGRGLRRTFRDVVSAPRRSTVRILSEGRPVALGAVLDSEGHILTKASEVTTADSVELSDQTVVQFTLIGVHSGLDVALLRISAESLSPVVWTTDEPQVGQWLITTAPDDAPLAIGVMSVAPRPIPRSDVRGVLGIFLEEQDPPRIKEIVPNSGASSSGLRPGDEVLEIDGAEMASVRQLIRTVRGYRPGDTVQVRVRRDSDEFSYPVTLTHPFGEFLSRTAFQNQMGGALSFRRDDFPSVFQHDAVLKPEQCGGPVVTLSGAAVGINIARAGRTESFVLPARQFLPLIEDLKSGRHPPPTIPANAPAPDMD